MIEYDGHLRGLMNCTLAKSLPIPFHSPYYCFSWAAQSAISGKKSLDKMPMGIRHRPTSYSQCATNIHCLRPKCRQLQEQDPMKMACNLSRALSLLVLVVRTSTSASTAAPAAVAWILLLRIPQHFPINNMMPSPHFCLCRIVRSERVVVSVARGTTAKNGRI